MRSFFNPAAASKPIMHYQITWTTAQKASRVHLHRRVEKLKRYTHWRFAPGDRIPLWWHIGRPNFGDDINPVLFEKLTSRRVRFAANRNRPHLMGAGSILEQASACSVVCGSGFLQPTQGQVKRPAGLVAVRGARSLAAFDFADEVLLGDPMVLISEFITPVDKRYRFGLIPHVLSTERWHAMNANRLKLIHPGAPPWQVVCDIAACEVVLSQSLHGLIAADALVVPNVWISPSEKMAGGRFKFDDYFSTIDEPKEMVPETEEIFSNPHKFDAGIGHYRYSKSRYRVVLSQAVEALAAELNAS